MFFYFIFVLMIKKPISSYPIYIGIVCIVIYFLPYLILGENAYIRIHDNLDGEFVYRVLASKAKYLFNYKASVTEVMNGLPRYCLQSGLNMTMFLFCILSPLKAYLLNDFIARVIAFIGMYLLLGKHFTNEKSESNLMRFLVAFCFAVIPTSSIYCGLTVAGQPLLLFAFLNLLKGKKSVSDFIIITLFPLCSSFILSGIFICIALGIILLVDIYRNKRINLYFLSGLLILGFGYLLVEFNLITSYFSNTFISHRKEWIIEPFVFSASLKESVQFFIQTQYHTGAFFTIPIIIAALIALTIKKKSNLFLYLVLSIVSIVVFYFIFKFSKCELGNTIALFKTFQWERFYFLMPMLWILLLFVCVNYITSRYSKYIAFALLAIQLVAIIAGDKDYTANLSGKKSDKNRHASYKEFYASNIFSDVGNYISKNKSDYRIVCIGFPPSVAQYNDFCTLDSYQTNYPLEYKHQFRKIIEKELDKNPTLKSYFDGWGNRCYIFVNGLDKSKLYGKRDNVELNNLELNTGALKEMGGAYVLSSVKIDNYEQNNLKFEKEFSGTDSFYDIYLYKTL